MPPSVPNDLPPSRIPRRQPQACLTCLYSICFILNVEKCDESNVLSERHSVASGVSIRLCLTDACRAVQRLV